MKIWPVEQGSQEWVLLHKGRLTASEFEKVITPGGKPSGQVKKIIARLISDTHSPLLPPRAESWTSRPAAWGIDCEPEARRWYSLNAGYEVETVGFITTDDERFGCSPDGLIYNGSEAPIGALELKCLQADTHAAHLLEDDPVESLLKDHRPQVHGQLAVADAVQWVDLLAYCPGYKTILVRVSRDEYTEKLKAALESFWTQFQEALAKIRGMQ